MEHSPSIRLTMEAAARFGYEALLVHPNRLNVPFNCNENPDQGLGFSKSLFYPDLVLTRLGASAPESAIHSLQYLESLRIPCINSSFTFKFCRDKAESYRKLSEAGVPIPVTLLLGAGASLEEAAEIVPGPPWIVKLPLGSKGNGVLIADSFISLQSIVDVLHGLGQQILLQEAVMEAQGCDVRVLVLGGKAIAAMRRHAKENDFRSNLHLGGTAGKLELTEVLRSLAERATQALNADIAGVDILESRKGPVVIEVNGSPGLEGIGRATGKDIAAEVMDFAQERLSQLKLA